MRELKNLHRCFIHCIAIFIAGIAIAGCSSIDCSLENRVLCHMRFVDMDGDSVVLKYPLTVVLVRAAGDTVHYYNKQANASSIDVPLSYVGEEDMLEMELEVTDTVEVETIVTNTDPETGEVTTETVKKDSVMSLPLIDEIRIRKTNEPWFESVDCNAHYNHTIQEAVADTHNFIDHIIVNDAYVNNDSRKKNLFIQVK